MLTNDDLSARLRAASERVPPGSRWRRWDGQEATVVDVRLGEWSGLPLVVAQPDEDWLPWVCPLSEWEEGNYWFSRFTRVG